jgi:L-ornithine N5-oxygenase
MDLPPVNGTHDHDAVPQLVNGATNGVREPVIPKSIFLRPAESDTIHDLVCVGFGPASLAIAVALHDSMEAGKLRQPPKVLFLERQPEFAWHAGMLLPGARMQISFIKDLASLRDPRSNFTFLNYLHKNNRLVDFTNLNTFLPARVEYEDYLRWCARHFDDVVRYQNEVQSVSPVQEEGPLKTFSVTSRNTKTGAVTTYRARNVVIALGGQASIPKLFPQQHPRVIHSSQYAQQVPSILHDKSAAYRVAVIGAGQSAAEIFNNVQSLYPNSKTYLVMRSEFLKPSDDSPL